MKVYPSLISLIGMCFITWLGLEYYYKWVNTPQPSAIFLIVATAFDTFVIVLNVWAWCEPSPPPPDDPHPDYIMD